MRRTISEWWRRSPSSPQALLAMACSGLFDACLPCGYAGSPCAAAYVPAYSYTGCSAGCGW